MSTFAIVLVVVLVLIVLLVLGGIVASARIARARAAALKAEVEQANELLAEAHATDNGWNDEEMEAAVRAAWSSGRNASAPIAELHLVQVIDRPGIDQDEAVYRVIDAGGHEHDIGISRSGGVWGT